MSGPRRRRKEREKKWLAEQVEQASEGRREATGSFYVLNLETWEKTPGLNLQQAQELWASLPRANYFSMDHYSKKPAPGRAAFDAGQLP